MSEGLLDDYYSITDLMLDDSFDYGEKLSMIYSNADFFFEWKRISKDVFLMICAGEIMKILNDEGEK